jgi:hypothetical protein
LAAYEIPNSTTQTEGYGYPNAIFPGQHSHDDTVHVVGLIAAEDVANCASIEFAA